jgi:hypothetical protein
MQVIVYDVQWLDNAGSGSRRIWRLSGVWFRYECYEVRCLPLTDKT